MTDTDEQIEIDRIKIFARAIAEHGLDLTPTDIDDVEGFIFDRREPRSQFVRAVIMDSLAEAIDEPCRWIDGMLYFFLGRRRTSTPDLRALAAFVQAAVPMEAVGKTGYYHWLSRTSKYERRKFHQN